MNLNLNTQNIKSSTHSFAMMEIGKTKLFAFCLSMTLTLGVITVLLYKQDPSEVIVMAKRITNDTELTNITQPDREQKNKTRNDNRPAPLENLLDISFPHTYHATGVITLPYDGIMEPFEAWYAEKHNMSRIDYYYGADKTFQRGDLLDYGVYIKEIPIHKQKKGGLSNNTISCWFHVAKSWEPIRPQPVVPFNTASFKFIGNDFRGGQRCYKLRKQMTIQNKTNVYTLWVTERKPYVPVRYEINGFNLLLNAPYDHYFIDYISFKEWKMDPEIMQVPKGSWCHKAAKKTRSRYFTNPMAEFVHENETMHAKHERHVEHTFLDFQRKHGKSYSTVHEHEKRKNIFRHNMRFIRSKNRQGLNFTLAPNHLADLTDEEYQALHGTFDTVNGDAWKDEDAQIPKRGEVPRIRFDLPDEPLPKNLDWREYGVVTPVKGQGQCGACWAFSALAAVEGAYTIATGKLEDFSAQQLLDCTFGYDNYACRGGWPWKAMQWVALNGVATTASYGRYLAQEGFCHCSKKENCTVAHIDSFGDVQRDNSTALKVALATYGPVSVAVNTNPKTFKFYSDGIYDDPSCLVYTHHSVAAVGYGQTKEGQEYWIIKNSWNAFWGKNGFIKIATKGNICGVTHSNGVVVKFKHNKGKLPFKKMRRDPSAKVFMFDKPEVIVSPLPFK